jgi:XRE family transcriptional regulator, regulator of sulfur utilization
VKVSLSQQFGDRIRELRMAKGLSQEELAERSAVHRTFIGRVERGETNVTLENIKKIAVGLDVPLVELFHQLNGKDRNPRDEK